METIEFIETVKAGDAEQVRTILEQNPALAEARDENGVSALMLTRYYHANDLLTHAVRAARRDVDLFEAATLGEVDRLRELLDANPSLVRAWSSDHATALHFAAFFAQSDAALLLLEHGSDVGAVSPTFGNVTSLHSAAAGGSREIVHALMEADANPNARQEGGFTALHSAAQNGDEEMARDLLEHGADPTLATDDGRTAAAIAKEKGHEALAALLDSPR